MKKTFVFLVMFFFFTAESVFAADFKSCLQKIETLKKEGISYNISSTTKYKKKQTVNATIYMKGNKIKIDAPEGVTIIDGKFMYMYIEKDNVAMKMNVDSNTINQTTFDLVQDKANELEFVGSDTKNGYACQIFKAKDIGKDVLYYLTDEYGLPTYVKEEKTETNITNFKVGNISDSVFTLPKGVRIADVTNFSVEDMLKGMQ